MEVNEFYRFCPLCKKVLTYSSVSSRDSANKRNGHCRNCCRLGHVHSEETRRKIGLKSAGRIFSLESRQKMSKSQLGTKQSKETIEKRRQKNLGRKQSQAEIEKRRQSNLGKKRSPEARKNISNGLKGNIPANKGKSHIEMHGEAKAKEISLKMSKAGKGKTAWNKGLTKETDSRVKKYADNRIGKTWLDIHGYEKSEQLKDLKRGKNNVSHRPEIKKAKRLQMHARLQSNLKNGYQLQPFYNSKGCKYFNQLMLETNTHIRHAQNGGEYHIKELGYWVDGYDSKNNIVYEYDEGHHFDINGNLKEKDIHRQKEIIEHLNCKFIRIKHINK